MGISGHILVAWILLHFCSGELWDAKIVRIAMNMFIEKLF